MAGQPARVPPVYDGPIEERVELPDLQLPGRNRWLPADTGFVRVPPPPPPPSFSEVHRCICFLSILARVQS